MKYFIKDLMVHKYPPPKDCNYNYVGERVLKTIPLGFEKCKKCFPDLPT